MNAKPAFVFHLSVFFLSPCKISIIFLASLRENEMRMPREMLLFFCVSRLPQGTSSLLIPPLLKTEGIEMNRIETDYGINK